MNLRSPGMRGFTLIELVVVIAVLAILAAVALPRFIEVSSSAHENSVRATGSGLQTGVVMVRAQWFANGAPGGGTQNVEGFGEDNIDVSGEGWPTGLDGNTDPTNMDPDTCEELWPALFQGSAPTVSTGTATDYQVTVSDQIGDGNGDCVFTYQPDGRDNTIVYDPNSGVVDVTIN